MSPEAADVVIVGGGPAGLATAIQARLAGLSVILVDPARPPIDRACGEGIMPPGWARLEEMGVQVPASQRAPFFGIRYLDGDLVAEGRFPSGCGQGIRRTALHQAMVERAAELGAELRWGVAARRLVDRGVECDHGEVHGRWLVAADGRSSRVRRWAGLARPVPRRKRFGIRRHFEIEPWTDLVEVHWAAHTEAYVTPVAPREVGVALLWDGSPSGFDELLQRFPALAERLDGGPVASRDRGAGPLVQRPRRRVQDHLALVGDASGTLDPITGEGLTLAFLEASAVVEAMQAGRLELYESSHRRLAAGPRRLTSLVLLLERLPRLRRRVLRSMARDRTLLSRFLAQVESAAPRLLGPDSLPRLAAAAVGWRL